MQENTGFSIINLRDGGEIRLIFPEEINTDDRSNWEPIDVRNLLKPLSFGGIEPQQITVNDLCIDNTRTNQSVEPTIEPLRKWMRSSEGRGTPDLQIVTVGFQQRCILSSLNVKRSFFHAGVCVRAYLNMTFDELSSGGLQIETTTKRRSNNSVSGNTFQ